MLAVAVATALVAAQAPASTAPTAKAETATSAPVTKRTAAELARTVAPADIMVPVELEQARKAILLLPQLDTGAKDLETEYPGIWAAIWTAVEPEMRRSVQADYPKFWASLERLYTSRLTEEEGEAILAFYRSPTGQKLIHGLVQGVQNIDTTPILKDVVESPSGTVSAEHFGDWGNAARAAAIKDIGPESLGDLLILMHSINLEKFKALGMETRKLTLSWVNDRDPEAEQRLKKLMQNAMEDYMAKHAPKK